MKVKNLSLIVIVGINIILCFAGCKRDDEIYFTTLEKIYIQHKWSEISECTYNGQMVYSVFDNRYDGGAVVYDDKGRAIAQCGWAWSVPPWICGHLQNCNVIYRCHGFITGQPFVDVYGLSN